MNANNLLDILKPKNKDSPSILKIGTIPAGYTTGRPTILFDGETTASVRTYPYLGSYIPAANDRVLVAAVGHGSVILGKFI